MYEKIGEGRLPALTPQHRFMNDLNSYNSH